MNFISDKNFPLHSSRITSQELQLRHLLQSEDIPFEFQKVFSLPNCRYIVDFFLPLQTILECSSTTMLKYQIPLRKKAIYLEAKSSQLKKYFSHLSIWVLFETCQPILEPFFRTLVRLMPSVDKILTSGNELLESLQIFFKGRLNFSNRNSFSSAFFSLYSYQEPSFDKHSVESFHESPIQNYSSYNNSKSEFFREPIQQLQNTSLNINNCLFNNYSHKPKKNFINRSEVFKK